MAPQGVPTSNAEVAEVVVEAVASNGVVAGRRVLATLPATWVGLGDLEGSHQLLRTRPSGCT